ncbi:Urease accessory protein UreD [Penicillium brevicompactum]
MGTMTMVPQKPQPGTGELEVNAFCGSSSIIALSCTYPLKLVSPPSRLTDHAVLVFMMSYGGGLVAGDRVDLNIGVRPKSRLALLTQGSTKVYKTPSKSICSYQILTVTVEAGAALLLLPDPVQPFKDSSYEQCQIFHVHHSLANILVLDWVSGGRTARGEAWEFFGWKGRNEIWSLPDPEMGIRKKLLLRDILVLDETSSTKPNYSDEMDDLGVFGTLIIRGPLFRALGDFFLTEFSRLPRIRANGKSYEQVDLKQGESVKTWTAASVRSSVIVKFGSQDVDAAKRWLRDMLLRDGTVGKEFGERALLCLQ